MTQFAASAGKIIMGEITLWDDQRTLATCQRSAAAMVLRLKDRGWQCQYRDF
ncbi:MAG: hypothetical protein ACI8VC_002724 [Candidatus Endobugula sp.]|jgi:hypothetical protein